MADQPPTPSGSRWEPDPDAAETTETAAAADPTTDTSYGAADADPTGTAVPLEEPEVDARRTQLRGRAVLAGAATALALGGGLVGFVIGHSTAGNDTFDVRQAGFTGQQDGGQQGSPPGGQLGEGQRPPGFGRDGDPDGDGDHGFGQPPPGSTDGGSSSSSSGNGAGTTGNPT